MDRRKTSAGQDLLKRIKIKEIELLKLKIKHDAIRKSKTGGRKRMKLK
jgi:hypothetical protein